MAKPKNSNDNDGCKAIAIVIGILCLLLLIAALLAVAAALLMGKSGKILIYGILVAGLFFAILLFSNKIIWKTSARRILEDLQPKPSPRDHVRLLFRLFAHHPILTLVAPLALIAPVIIVSALGLDEPSLKIFNNPFWVVLGIGTTFVGLLASVTGMLFAYYAQSEAADLRNERSFYTAGFDGFQSRILALLDTKKPFWEETRHLHKRVQCVFLTPFLGHAGLEDDRWSRSGTTAYDRRLVHAQFLELLECLDNLLQVDNLELELITLDKDCLAWWYAQILAVSAAHRRSPDATDLDWTKEIAWTRMLEEVDALLPQKLESGGIQISGKEIQNFNDILRDNQYYIKRNWNKYNQTQDSRKLSIRTLHEIPFQLVIVSAFRKQPPATETIGSNIPPLHSIDSLLSHVGSYTYTSILQRIRDKGHLAGGRLDIRMLLDDLHACHHSQDRSVGLMLMRHFANMWATAARVEVPWDTKNGILLRSPKPELLWYLDRWYDSVEHIAGGDSDSMRRPQSSLSRRAADYCTHLRLESIKPNPERNPLDFEIIYNYPPATNIPEVKALPPLKNTLGRTSIKGAYVHVPFCFGRCEFCHYSRKIAPTPASVDAYIDALEKEVSLWREELGRTSQLCPDLATVYFGGGTPTILSAAQINRICGLIRESCGLDAMFRRKDGYEYTWESSPETLTKEKLEALGQNGVNRMSIGIQSFCDHTLKECSRSHDAADAERAFEVARMTGFQNINIDLIYAFPEQIQNEQQWEESLQEAVRLKPESISLHQLRLIPGTNMRTRFATADQLPQDNERRHQIAMAHVILGENRYVPIEPEIFVKDSEAHRHRHQEDKWVGFSELIGFGPAAYGFLGAKRVSYFNHWSLDAYAAAVNAGKLPIERLKALTEQEYKERVLVLGLTFFRGINRKYWSETFHGTEILNDEIFGPRIRELVEIGVLEATSQHVRLSVRGGFFGSEYRRQLGHTYTGSQYFPNRQ